MSNQLQHKLSQFEATPPPKIWEAINTALDDGPTSYADNLYNYKQHPETGVWNKIEQQLNNNTSAVILPFYKRFSQQLKYVGAAAILVAVATIITLFLNQDAVSNEVAIHPAMQKQAIEDSKPADPNQLNTVIQPLNEEENKPAIAVEKASIQNEKKGINRYVTMADEEGKEVRLSKKAYTIFNCAENSAAFNNERCKENIQLMQQKMAASLLSPSGDFGGLIDMLKSLEDND